jgi:TPR repeat protein
MPVEKRQIGVKVVHDAHLASGLRAIRGRGHNEDHRWNLDMKNDDGSVLYEKALALANSVDPDLDEVESLLRKAASLSSENANFALGSWHFHGVHLQYSIEKAIAFWEIAAKLGSIDACLELAKIYERGEFSEKSDHKTLNYYFMAATLGSGQAYFELARSYFHGIFTQESRIIYEKLIEKAEKLGFDENI